jgi:uncharacterized protein YjdB
MKNLLFVLLTLPFVFISCDKEDKKILLSGIEMGEEAIEIRYGEELQLSVFPKPEKAVLPQCIFFSENEKIVTVSGSGLIKGVGMGVATVGAKTPDGEYYAECNVKVDDLYREPYLDFGCST